MKNKSKKQTENVNNSNEKLLLSDVINRLLILERCNAKLYEHHNGDYFISEDNKDGKYVRWKDIERLIDDVRKLNDL